MKLTYDVHSFYPLAAGGAVGFRKFSEIFCLQGALKSRGGAEDFDKFCKNVIEKFLKIE